MWASDVRTHPLVSRLTAWKTLIEEKRFLIFFDQRSPDRTCGHSPAFRPDSWGFM